MRNPDRIKPFLDTLEKCWAKVPDWRFGQLIENIKRAYDIDDLFYIEDDKLEELIKDCFELNEKKEEK